MTKTHVKSDPSEVNMAQEEKGRREQLDRENRVRTQVLSLLGRPPKLRTIQVCPTAENTFRVNVYVEERDQKRISDSFFIRTSCVDDRIISSSPLITKKY